MDMPLAEGDTISNPLDQRCALHYGKGATSLNVVGSVFGVLLVFARINNT
jgi:hypothetical protein